MQLTTILSIAILAYTQTQAIALPEPFNIVINIEESTPSPISPSPSTSTSTTSHHRNEPVHAQCYSAGCSLTTADCFSDGVCCWNWCKWSLGSFPGTCQGKFKPGSFEEEEEEEFLGRGEREMGLEMEMEM
ncbi:hypothetical protein BKA65DRAFT_542840 [Rhexocercosporidium sp. MPI-PUGE-AT-0058]|nr:hypothetical protein BKA65DRAFT_542840 [Rhexocercosporidium sp. MPI-PUGE-AT-0058]